MRDRAKGKLFCRHCFDVLEEFAQLFPLRIGHKFYVHTPFADLPVFLPSHPEQFFLYGLEQRGVQTFKTGPDELDGLITQWLMGYTKKELFELCYEKGVPFLPLTNMEDVVKDPQLNARDFFLDVDHPYAGVVKFPGVPYKLSKTPSRIKRPAPTLGQHNSEIYCGRLGFSKEELKRMKEKGII